MYLEIGSKGRVFLRRDLSKYRHIHTQGQGMKIVYDAHQSQREKDGADQLDGIIRAVIGGRRREAWEATA